MSSDKTWYRMIDARYTIEIDEIAHTILYSGRYNPRGEFAVLYFSSSPECCWREKLKQVQGRASDLPPQAVGRFDCNLSKCLEQSNTTSHTDLATILTTTNKPPNILNTI